MPIDFSDVATETTTRPRRVSDLPAYNSPRQEQSGIDFSDVTERPKIDFSDVATPASSPPPAGLQFDLRRDGRERYTPPGAENWNLRTGADGIRDWFQRTRGRELPVSNFGQSQFETSAGWNHENAMDVRVNPLTAEGQSLLQYLRENKIPYQAFSRAMKSKTGRTVATGPHIHVGLPSRSIRNQPSGSPRPAGMTSAAPAPDFSNLGTPISQAPQQEEAQPTAIPQNPAAPNPVSAVPASPGQVRPAAPPVPVPPIVLPDTKVSIPEPPGPNVMPRMDASDTRTEKERLVEGIIYNPDGTVTETFVPGPKVFLQTGMELPRHKPRMGGRSGGAAPRPGATEQQQPAPQEPVTITYDPAFGRVVDVPPEDIQARSHDVDVARMKQKRARAAAIKRQKAMLRAMSGVTPKDLWWHFGINDPAEMHNWSPRLQRNVLLKTAQLKAEDARKRAQGQEITRPTDDQINANRRRIGMAENPYGQGNYAASVLRDWITPKDPATGKPIRIDLPQPLKLQRDSEGRIILPGNVALGDKQRIDEQIARQVADFRARVRQSLENRRTDQIWEAAGSDSLYTDANPPEITEKDVDEEIARIRERELTENESTFANLLSAVMNMQQPSGVLWTPDGVRTYGVSPAVKEGLVGSIGGTLSQLGNLQQYLGGNSAGQSNFLQRAGRTLGTAVERSEEMHPARNFMESLLLGTQRGIGALPLEYAKLTALEPLGALNLPLQGALSVSPDEKEKILPAIVKGLGYHYSMGLTQPLGPVFNSLTWTAVPTLEGMAEGKGFARSFGESLPIGLAAGTGVGHREAWFRARGYEPFVLKSENGRAASVYVNPEGDYYSLRIRNSEAREAERRTVEVENDTFNKITAGSKIGRWTRGVVGADNLYNVMRPNGGRAEAQPPTAAAAEPPVEVAAPERPAADPEVKRSAARAERAAGQRAREARQRFTEAKKANPLDPKIPELEREARRRQAEYEAATEAYKDVLAGQDARPAEVVRPADTPPPESVPDENSSRVEVETGTNRISEAGEPTNGTPGPDGKIVPSQAANASAPSRLAPVPESPQTIAAQYESAARPDSPRVAVFHPDQAQAPEKPGGFARIFFRNGSVLDYNPEKARAQGLPFRPEEMRRFVEQNGFEPLIGKVAASADTSTGVALRTEDARGRELSTSIVPDEASARAQAEVDRQQFPQASAQELMPAQEAVRRRLAEGQRTSPQYSPEQVAAVKAKIMAGREELTPEDLAVLEAEQKRVNGLVARSPENAGEGVPAGPSEQTNPDVKRVNAKAPRATSGAETPEGDAQTSETYDDRSPDRTISSESGPHNNNPGQEMTPPAERQAEDVGLSGEVRQAGEGQKRSIARMPGLDAGQRDVEARAIEEALKRPDEIIDQYFREFGNRKIDADKFKLLLPEYAKDPARYASAVHNSSSYLAERAFMRRLGELPPGGSVLFTAGGQASGKTTSIGQVEAAAALDANADLIYDTMMSKPDKAFRIIEAAKQAGQDVTVIYVHADVGQAARQMLGRAAGRERRTVEAGQLARGHMNARDTFFKLWDRYKSDPQVALKVLDNTGSSARLADVETLRRAAYNQNYSETLRRVREAIEDEYRRSQTSDNPIPEDIFRAAKTEPQTAEASGSHSGEGNPQPERSAPQTGEVEPTGTKNSATTAERERGAAAPRATPGTDGVAQTSETFPDRPEKILPQRTEATPDSQVFESEKPSASDATTQVKPGPLKMARPYSLKLRYADAIDDFLKGKLRPHEAVLVSEGTPTVFRRLGLRNSDIIITQATLAKVLRNKHWEDIAPSVLKRIPYQLENPVMVAWYVNPETREKGLNIVTSIMVANQRKVVVAGLHFDKTFEGYAVHKLATVHAKDFPRTLEEWKRDQKFLFVNTEKSRRVFPTFSIEFATEGKTAGSNKTILTEKDLVKNPPSGMARLRERLPAARENVGELAASVASDRSGNRVHVNAEGAEIMRRVFFSGEGAPDDAASFAGMFLEPEHVKAAVRALGGLAADMLDPQMGYSARDAQPLLDLAQHLLDAAEERKETVIVTDSAAPGAAAPHEGFHQGSFLGSDGAPLEDRHTRIEELDETPAAEKWREYYAGTPEYANASRGLVVEETAATIAGGDYAKMGITDEEAGDFLELWTRSFREKNGPHAFEYFEEQEPHVKEAIRRARASAAAEGQEQGSIGRGDQTGRRTRGRLARAEAESLSGVRPEAAGETDAGRAAERGEVEPPPLPEPLREQSRQAADELSPAHPNRFSNEEKGPDWLRKVGLQLPETEAKIAANPRLLTEADLVKPLKVARQPDKSITITNLKGDEFGGDELSNNELRASASRWAKENLQGHSFVNSDTGWAIGMGRGGWRKSISHSARRDFVQSMAALPRLLETSVLVHSEPNTDVKTANDIRSYHTLVGALDLAGQFYRVRITVKETNAGQRFYDHAIFESEKPAASDATTRVNPDDSPEAAGPSIKLSELVKGSKNLRTLLPDPSPRLKMARRAEIDLAEGSRAKDIKEALKPVDYPVARLPLSDDLNTYWQWFKENLENKSFPTPLGKPAVIKRGHFLKLIAGGNDKGYIPGASSWDEIVERIEGGTVKLDDPATAPQGFDYHRARNMSLLPDLLEHPQLILRPKDDRGTLLFIKSYGEKGKSLDDWVGVFVDLKGEVGLKSWYARGAITTSWLAKHDLVWAENKYGVDFMAQPRESSRETADEAASSHEKIIPQGDEPLKMARPQTPQDLIHYAKQFGQKIAQFLQGKLSATQPVFIMEAPDLFLRLGLRDREVVMLERNLSKVLKDKIERDRIPGDLLRDLPFQLADPVAVFDSTTQPGTFIFVTSWTDGDGRPIVAAVHPDVEHGRIIVHDVKSVYGKDDFSNALRSWLKGPRYYDTERSPEMFRTFGVQFPTVLTPQGSSQRVLTEDDIVKPLKMARPDEQLRNEKNVGLLASRVTSERNGSTVIVNAEGAEVMRRALAPDEEKLKRAASLDGVFLNPGQMRAAVRALHGLAADMLDAGMGYSASDAQGLRDLAQNLSEAAKERKETVVVKYAEAPDSTEEHEGFHQDSYLGAGGKSLEDRHARIEELARHRAVEAWREYYRHTPEHARASRGVAVEEAAGTIAGGDYEKLGLTDAEADDYLKLWFASYIEENGDQSVSEFRRRREQVKQAISAARAQIAAQGETAAGRADAGLRDLQEGRRPQKIPPEAEGQTDAGRESGEVTGRSLSDTPPAQVARPEAAVMPRRAWPRNFPKVVAHTSIAKLKSHPDYRAAKAGDAMAAARVVDALVKDERLGQLARRYADAIVVPVLEREREGTNMLPLAYAHAFEFVGLEVTDDINSISRVSHTGASAVARLVSRKQFEGEVVRGRNYIIVDDVVTLGGTVNALRHYIESQGGRVVAVSSLSFARSGNIIAIRPETVRELEGRFSRAELEQLLSEEGIARGIRALTEAEGQSVLRFRSLDALRTRIAEERDTRELQSNKAGAGRTQSPEGPPKLAAPVERAHAEARKIHDLQRRTAELRQQIKDSNHALKQKPSEAVKERLAALRREHRQLVKELNRMRREGRAGKLPAGPKEKLRAALLNSDDPRLKSMARFAADAKGFDYPGFQMKQGGSVASRMAEGMS